MLVCAGVYVENTIEAMQALVQRDNGPEGPVPDLHYIEVDVQASSKHVGSCFLLQPACAADVQGSAVCAFSRLAGGRSLSLPLPRCTAVAAVLTARIARPQKPPGIAAVAASCSSCADRAAFCIVALSCRRLPTASW